MATTSRTIERTAVLAAAPWLDHYPRWVPSTLRYPSVPAWRLLERAAEEHPQRIACWFFDASLTYRELFDAARRAASALLRLGVRRGDRVGILLPNTPEYLIALNGIWMAGGVAMAISPLMVAEEVSALLEATECRAVVGLDILAPLLFEGPYRPELVLLTTLEDRLPHWKRMAYPFARRKHTGRWRRTPSKGIYEFDEELRRSSPVPRTIRRVTSDSPALVQPTGGTTGRPKAVVLTHGNVVGNAWQLRHWIKADCGRETVLAVLPFFHSYGLSTCVTNGAALAATVILHPRYETRAAIGLIERHRPTLFPAVPAMLAAMNHRLEHRPADLSSLRFVISGGAPLDPAVGRRFAELSGATVVEGYGLSEAGPVTHSGPLDGNARPGSIGIPLPDTDARLVDAETGSADVAPGEVGELVVRGPQVMQGYWNFPEETARVLRDGWLFTGDLATCDADGFFRIVDRKKDLIITSGFNVYPGEVEDVLRRCPGVADAAVVGVADAARGQVVKAIVVTKPGATFDKRALDDYCRKHLAKHKRPRIFEPADGDLPRNFLGKVLRRRLREGGVEHAVEQMIEAEQETEDGQSVDEV
jgi:long-chain acyl-CoA synthetase